MKGYDKLDPKDNEGQLQSSMKEWEQSVKQYENPRPEEQIYDELNDPYGGR